MPSWPASQIANLPSSGSSMLHLLVERALQSREDAFIYRRHGVLLGLRVDRVLISLIERPRQKNRAGNRLEALQGSRAGRYSIRINDQFRLCFRWTAAGAEEVEIVDYH